MTHRVTLIPGDGVGPEVTEATRRVLEATGVSFHWDLACIGAEAQKRWNTPLPESVIQSIRENGVALKGPVTTPVGSGFRSVNVALRKELELYAKGVHEVLKYTPGKRLATSTMPIKSWNEYILRKAMQKNTMIMVPYYDFDKYLGKAGLEELGKKVVITSTVYDERVEFLRKRGVDMIVDNTPKILDRVVGVNVLEAMIIAAMGKPSAKITDDEFKRAKVADRK